MLQKTSDTSPQLRHSRFTYFVLVVCLALKTINRNSKAVAISKLEVNCVAKVFCTCNILYFVNELGHGVGS